MTSEELKYYQMARLIELLQIKLSRNFSDHSKIEAVSEVIKFGRHGFTVSGTGKTYPEAVINCATEIKTRGQELLDEINKIMTEISND